MTDTMTIEATTQFEQALADWLESRDPELAEMVRDGSIDDNGYAVACEAYSRRGIEAVARSTDKADEAVRTLEAHVARCEWTARIKRAKARAVSALTCTSLFCDEPATGYGPEGEWRCGAHAS